MSDEDTEENVVEFDHATPILTAADPVRDCLELVKGWLENEMVGNALVLKNQHGEMTLKELINASLCAGDETPNVPDRYVQVGNSFLPVSEESLEVRSDKPDLNETLRIVSEHITDLLKTDRMAPQTDAIQMQKRIVDAILEKATEPPKEDSAAT